MCHRLREFRGNARHPHLPRRGTQLHPRPVGAQTCVYGCPHPVCAACYAGGARTHVAVWPREYVLLLSLQKLDASARVARDVRHALHVFLRSLPVDCLFNIVQAPGDALWPLSRAFDEDALVEAATYVDGLGAGAPPKPGPTAGVAQAPVLKGIAAALTRISDRRTGLLDVFLVADAALPEEEARAVSTYVAAWTRPAPRQPPLMVRKQQFYDATATPWPPTPFPPHVRLQYAAGGGTPRLAPPAVPLHRRAPRALLAPPTPRVRPLPRVRPPAAPLPLPRPAPRDVSGTLYASHSLPHRPELPPARLFTLGLGPQGCAWQLHCLACLAAGRATGPDPASPRALTGPLVGLLDAARAPSVAHVQVAWGPPGRDPPAPAPAPAPPRPPRPAPPVPSPPRMPHAPAPPAPPSPTAFQTWPAVFGVLGPWPHDEAARAPPVVSGMGPRPLRVPFAEAAPLAERREADPLGLQMAAYAAVEGLVRREAEGSAAGGPRAPAGGATRVAALGLHYGFPTPFTTLALVAADGVADDAAARRCVLGLLAPAPPPVSPAPVPPRPAPPEPAARAGPSLWRRLVGPKPHVRTVRVPRAPDPPLGDPGLGGVAAPPPSAGDPAAPASPGPAPPEGTDADALLDIVRQQEPSGCWRKPVPPVPGAAPPARPAAYPQDLWGTALTAAVLRVHFADRRGEWALAVQKADAWLGRRAPNMQLLDGHVQSALGAWGLPSGP